MFYHWDQDPVDGFTTMGPLGLKPIWGPIH